MKKQVLWHLLQKSLKEWEAEVYRAAGPNRDAHAFYIAHAATMPALPEIQITAADTMTMRTSVMPMGSVW